MSRTTPVSRTKSVLPWILGTPTDWHLPQLRRQLTRFPRIRPSGAWLGNLVILATLVAGWFAFTSVQVEEGTQLTTAFSLWVGATSILLMAWSFVLAIRVKFLERFFGGLDGIYRTHRWTGTLAVLAMFGHTQVEPEVDGIRGASKAVADAAEELAGVGEVMIYVLIAATVIRLLPYRWWRWTHKAFGIPYLMACWHFFTAEKPYDNASAWGYWFLAWMVAGAAAWAWRLVVRDAGVGSRSYVVTGAEHEGRLTRLTLRPTGRAIGHRAGQFAFLKLKTGTKLTPGDMSEPHPFTIASSPKREGGELEFVIAHLGDWSAKLPELDLVGVDASIEGPHGHFHPRAKDRSKPTLWVAGGVGITPFLAAIDERRLTGVGVEAAEAMGEATPTLLYCTRDATDDAIVPELRAAEAAGAIRLEVFDRSTGRLRPERIDQMFPNGLSGYHVAVCGPESLVADITDAAHQRGASGVQSEDFDIRQGFGPERSREWNALVSRLLGREKKGEGRGPTPDRELVEV